MMPRNRNESNPDVNSPILDDEYDSGEKMPGKDIQRDIREPDGDDGSVKKPDIDESYRGSGRSGDTNPIEEPPRRGQETGDVDDSPKHV